MSPRTALWAVAALASVIVTLATCFVGDLAIHLMTEYGSTAVIRAVAGPFSYTDVVLLVAYRVLYRYRRPTTLAGSGYARRVAAFAWRWMWVPFVLVRVLAGAAVLALPRTDIIGGWSTALTMPLVAVVPLAAWYLARLAGRRLTRATGCPMRVLGLPISGGDAS